MNFFGGNDEAAQQGQQQLEMARNEMEMMTDLFNK